MLCNGGSDMTVVHFCADLAGVTPDETPQVMTGPEAVSTGPSMLLYAPQCPSMVFNGPQCPSMLLYAPQLLITS